MRKALFLFLFSISILHAQWIADLGNFYIDPALMLEKRVSHFTMVQELDQLDSLGNPQLFAMDFWVGAKGWVTGAGEVREKDTLVIYEYQPLPSDPGVYILKSDSIFVDSPYVFLYTNTGKYDQSLKNNLQFLKNNYIYDLHGRLLFRRLVGGGMGERHFDYYYTENRLDSMQTRGDANYSLYRYHYDKKGKLKRVDLYMVTVDNREMKTFQLGSSNHYYYKKGLLDKVTFKSPDAEGQVVLLVIQWHYY